MNRDRKGADKPQTLSIKLSAPLRSRFMSTAAMLMNEARNQESGVRRQNANQVVLVFVIADGNGVRVEAPQKPALPQTAAAAQFDFQRRARMRVNLLRHD